MTRFWVHVRMDDEDTEESMSLESTETGRKASIRFATEASCRLLGSHEWFCDEDSKAEASGYITRNIKKAFTGDDVALAYRGDIQTFMDMGEGTSIHVTVRVLYS